MITCPNCQRQVQDNSKFCDSCGVAVATNLPSQQTGLVCPQCQTPVSDYDYCEHCGASLAAVRANGQPILQSRPHPSPPLITRFVLQPANIIFPFPAGKQEVRIGREDPEQNLIPEINLEAYGGAEAGVSRQHAQMFFDGTQWQLKHLSQTNKTLVNDFTIYPGKTQPLKNGDVVVVGRITLIFRT